MSIDLIGKIFSESLNLHEVIARDKDFIESVSNAADAVVDALRHGNKIIIAGNGGSAADSQHFVAELVGRFEKERRGLPAIALSTNTSSITALANDYSYDEIFSHQVEALGVRGDVFFGISTSGKSPNIVSALKASNKMKLKTVALLGKGGGKCAEICDIPIIVPHDITARIQEIHILVIHTICAAVDEAF